MQNNFLRGQTSVVKERRHQDKERESLKHSNMQSVCRTGGRDIAFSLPCRPSYMWSEVGTTT